MQLNLQGRVAIVTGGSKGIGRSISLALAAARARVVVVARGQTAIDETCDAIKVAGGAAYGVACDVTSESAARKAVDATLTRFSSVDILVNNAGGAIRFGAFQELSEEDWMASYRFNVMGCVNFVKAAIPALLLSVAPRIITISSISGIQPGFLNPHYTVTKAATINLSKYLANVYSKDGILVNAVCPGPVHTDSWHRSVSQRGKAENCSFSTAWASLECEEEKKVPLGRVGEGHDIAPLVVFLASDHASWITGSCFHINGGKLATIS